MGRLHRGLRPQGQAGKLTQAARLLARGELDLSPDTHSSSHDAADDDRTHLAEAFAAFELVPEGGLPVAEPDGVFHVRDDALRSWRLYLQCQSQWITGLGGASGLNFAGVESHMRAHGLWQPPRRRMQLWEDVRAMADEAMQEWSKKPRK